MRKLSLIISDDIPIEEVIKQIGNIKGVSVENKNLKNLTIKEIYYNCLVNKNKYLAKFTTLADEYLDNGLNNIEFIIEFSLEYLYDQNVFEFAITFPNNIIPEYFDEYCRIEGTDLFTLSEGLYFYYEQDDVDSKKYFSYTFEIIKEI